MSDNKEQALAEKELGTAAYKKRDFETALTHYNKALELDDANMIFALNAAAAQLEWGKLDAAVADADKAIEIGRRNYADFKLIAKAYLRKGNALVRLERFDEAIEAFNKSLTENRTADALNALKAAEKALAEKKRLEYIDPAKAEEAKAAGNDAFKNHQFPEAVKHYGEAIRRDPDNHVLLSNRAAAYTKLGAFPEALKDCDRCLEMKPDFVKAYIRKAHVQMIMKDFSKAIETYEAGLAHDPQNAEMRQGLQQATMNSYGGGGGGGASAEETMKKAMADPEIQAILRDPYMQKVLQDLSTNPASMQEHLKDEAVLGKVQKLIRAGVLQTAPGPQR